MRDCQRELRTEIAKLVLQRLNDNEVTLVQAAVACWGVVAIILGTFAQATRERMALELEGELLHRANERAKEIRSGAFDREERGQ